MKRLAGVLVFFIVVLFMVSCQKVESKTEEVTAGKKKETGKAVVVLFDLTASTKKVRNVAFDSFRKVLSAISYGDVIVAAKITESSITEPDIPVKEVFPKFVPVDNWGNPTDNDFLVKAARKKADKDIALKKDSILKAVEGFIFAGDARKTDIISSLHVAERIFSTYKRDRSILVILSDMIEDSNVYNFERENLTARRIEEIIRRERFRKRIPDLRGVKVYIVPAGTLNTRRYFSIQNFWLRYFRECGANLAKENYGSPLLIFNE